MQAGEVLRRFAFNLLDKVRGGHLGALKAVNKECIRIGVTEEYRQKALRAILDEAAENCPFYRPVGKGAGLSDFPVMQKIDYVNHKEEILSDRFRDREDKLSRLNTSGSTGVPFTVLADPEKMARVYMNMLSVKELTGFRLGMKRAEFRVWIKGRNTRSRYNQFRNNLYMFDISNMSKASLAATCERLRKMRIQAIVAYSSALTALSDHIKAHKVDVSAWDVEYIFSMGEALPQSTYDQLTEQFGFSPVRSYGNNENGFIAVGLDGEERYTVDLYNFEIEILKMDEDVPVSEGELGRIVVTDYYNHAFPMIRYDTGDTGTYERITDENGRVRAWFGEIFGRRGSMLYNTKGEPLSIHVFMNVLLNLEDSVHQAKCIQWDRDRYEVLLNAERDIVDEEAVVASYRHYLGEDARIDVTYVDEIPVQASGKRLVCEQKCEAYL